MLLTDVDAVHVDPRDGQRAPVAQPALLAGRAGTIVRPTVRP